jgi:ribosome-binding protein aMBF1 (putative translation factor)
MTSAEFSTALQAIGWSQRHLARMLECDDKMVRRWATGALAVPPSIGKWLNRLVACHDRHPPPDDWRVYIYE